MKNVIILHFIIIFLFTFALDGKFLKEIKGDIKGERANYSYGLSLNGKNDIYILNSLMNKITKYNMDGDKIYSYNLINTFKPASLYVYNNKIYITDTGNHKTLIYEEKNNSLILKESFGLMNNKFYEYIYSKNTNLIFKKNNLFYIINEEEKSCAKCRKPEELIFLEW